MKLFESSETKIYAYFFDSLMTTVREFRTIKSCEFFETGQVILNPVLTLEQKEDEKWQGVDRNMERFTEKHS